MKTIFLLIAIFVKNDAYAFGTFGTGFSEDVQSTVAQSTAGAATALAANGTNCSSGQAARGVDASGNAEGCFVAGGSAPPGVSNSRTLTDSAAVISLDWENRVMNDSGNIPSVNYQARDLTDGFGVDSLKWYFRTLHNSVGTSVLDWTNGVQVSTHLKIVDGTEGAGKVFTDVNGSGLGSWETPTSGNPPGVSNARSLEDSSSILSVDWESRNLYDASAQQSINWIGRKLVNASAEETVDWDVRQLLNTNGNPGVDWGAQTLRDTNGDTSVNYGGRQLKNSADDVMLDWGVNGVRIFGGTNIVYRCTGSTGGTFDGTLSVVQNTGACPSGTWVATSLSLD